MREEQIRDIHRYRESDQFTALERDVIEYAVCMTQTPVDVPDELFERIRKAFDERQIVELTAAIAWENYLARFNHALEIPAHGFADGDYCPIPER